jgi:hypothetical protein
LSAPIEDQLKRALVITANAASFSSNQYFLRRAGCIPILNDHMKLSENEIQDRAIKALTNLAVSDENLEYMDDSIPILISNSLRDSGTSQMVRISTLICLTNLSVTPRFHLRLLPLVSELFENIDDHRTDLNIRVQSL